MIASEIMAIVGGLIVGYYVITRIINYVSFKPAKSNGSNNAGNNAQSNESWEKSPGNDTPKSEDSLSTSWFHILEVSENASREQIVAAYKQKISKYHPDKVAQMGFEIRDLAEKKSRQINAAYDKAMKL